MNPAVADLGRSEAIRANLPTLLVNPKHDMRTENKKEIPANKAAKHPAKMQFRAVSPAHCQARY